MGLAFAVGVAAEMFTASAGASRIVPGVFYLSAVAADPGFAATGMEIGRGGVGEVACLVGHAVLYERFGGFRALIEAMLSFLVDWIGRLRCLVAYGVESLASRVRRGFGGAIGNSLKEEKKKPGSKLLYIPACRTLDLNVTRAFKTATLAKELKPEMKGIGNGIVKPCLDCGLLSCYNNANDSVKPYSTLACLAGRISSNELDMDN